MALVEAARYDSAITAALARAYLASAGIDAFLFDDGFASLGLGPLLSVRLMVEAELLDQARDMLAETKGSD